MATTNIFSNSGPVSPSVKARQAGRPVIAVAIGDPAGIGPEVCLKASDSGIVDDVCDHFLVGDFDLLKRIARDCGIGRQLRQIAAPGEAIGAGETINVLQPAGSAYTLTVMGEPSAEAGRATLAWLDYARDLGERRLVDGVVDGPVDSESLMLTGEIGNPDDIQPAGSFLMRMAGNLRNVSLSEHIRIRDVPATVTQAAVLSLVKLVDSTLRSWGFPNPRIAVAALNPHGFFEEDLEEIAPAVAEARAAGIFADGPIAPDSVYRLCLEGIYDVVVSMYHDQGQIALKTAVFSGARTAVINLSYVHIVVPHGSAYDIAGKGIANSASLQQAMRTAGLLAAGRATELA